MLVAAISAPASRSNCTNAAPDSSVRSPRAEASLTVITTARIELGIVQLLRLLIGACPFAYLAQPGRTSNRATLFKEASDRFSCQAGQKAAAQLLKISLALTYMVVTRRPNVAPHFGHAQRKAGTSAELLISIPTTNSDCRIYFESR